MFKEDGPRRVSNNSHQPLVLKVQVLPPARPSLERNRLSRLDVLKQMFEVCVPIHLYLCAWLLTMFYIGNRQQDASI